MYQLRRYPKVHCPYPSLIMFPALPILSCLSLLYMCGLGLCPFSGWVCDLLLRGGQGLSPECASPEEYLSHNFDVHCLQDTGPCVALRTLVGGHHGTRCYVPW